LICYLTINDLSKNDLLLFSTFFKSENLKFLDCKLKSRLLGSFKRSYKQVQLKIFFLEILYFVIFADFGKLEGHHVYVVGQHLQLVAISSGFWVVGAATWRDDVGFW